MRGSAKSQNPFAPRIHTPNRIQKSSVLIRFWWWAGGFLFILIATVTAWYLLTNVFFLTKEVRIQQLVFVEPNVIPLDQMNRLSEGLRESSVLFQNTSQLEKEWLARFPSVKVFYVKKAYPEALEISFLPRIALCQVKSKGETFLVDKDGFVFGKAEASTLPTIASDSLEISIGSTLSARGILSALTLIKELRTITPQLKQVSLQPGQLDIKLASDPQIYVSELRDPYQTAAELSTMLTRFSAEKKLPKIIDMRYDRPVVRY